MTEVYLGRLLPASLHQAIADELPQRLDFYENWLRSEGLRDGTIGLAPMTAVVGFLRTEGAAYDRVMTRAGGLAADWSYVALPGWRRRFVAALPRRLRARVALRLAAELVQSVSRMSRVSATLKGRHARMEVRASIFCSVRDAQPTPLCGFYAALAARTLVLAGVPAAARVEQCRAVHGQACVLGLDLGASESAPVPAIAA
jgi:hypothetical protein